jgi:NAD(P)-dependent dehydrogenase (short-subunit alcohol dehydrogenase family)
MVTALSETALITGSTDGIGVTTARNILVGNNGVNEVLIHGRDDDRVRAVVISIQKSAENTSYIKNSNIATKRNVAVALPASDISTIDGCYELATSVRGHCRDTRSQTPKTCSESAAAATATSNLKILMNNAGVYSNGLIRTPDGLELTFAVNVLAPFVVTSMLLSTLLANGSRIDITSNDIGSRIVIASSLSQSWKLPKDYWEDPQYQKRPYSAHGAYSESKLLDAMLTIEMAYRLNEVAGIDSSIVTCNCLDPGTVNTKMLLDGWGSIGMHVDNALDEAWCCTSSELENISGQYFVGRERRQASGCAYDSFHRKKLWQTLCELAPTAAAEWDRAVQMYSTK